MIRAWRHYARAALLLSILAFPLVGAKAEDIVGCGCPQGGGGDDEGSTEGELPGGGGVSSSKSYSMERAEVGMSTRTVSSDAYTINGTVGHYLSQGRSLSDRYLVHHPFSRNVVTDGAALEIGEPSPPPEE